MRTIREVLRLRWEAGLSQREIGLSCRMGRSTVRDYLLRAEAAGVSWPLPEGMDEEVLERLLFPPPPESPRNRPLPDWGTLHQELRRKGMTLGLLWQEYRAAHHDGYGYSQFCALYHQWANALEPVLRQHYVAGEKLFVDYAGQTAPVVDRHTGEVRQAQIFVAVLGASNYTYVEATWTQGLADWLGS
jgi:transposase